jgi:hypothetical protein
MAGGKQYSDSDALNTTFQATCKVRSWCTYPHQAEKVDGAELNVEAMEKHAELIRALHALSPKFCFMRSSVALAIKVANSKMMWVTKEEHVKDYVTTLLNRVMGMSKVLNGIMNKKSQPKWLQNILMIEQVKVKEETANPWIEYGFDRSLSLAYRAKADGKKDYSVPIETLGDADDDWPTAFFDDGESLVVKDITSKELGLLTIARSMPARDQLWRGTHCVTHHLLELKQRPDKELKNQPIATKLLMAMYEQSRQIMQCRLCYFGPVTGDGACMPHDHPTVQAALEFMKPFAEGYAKDEYDVVAMIERKNQAFHCRGKFGKKKPAAATTSAAAPVKRPAAPTTETPTKKTKSMLPPPKDDDDDGEGAVDAEDAADGEGVGEDDGCPPPPSETGASRIERFARSLSSVDLGF